MIPFETLTSLEPGYQQLSSLIQSRSPPQSIYVHSPLNTDFSLNLIIDLLNRNRRSQWSNWSSIKNESLPNFVKIDLVEIGNSSGLFDRILDRLAGWKVDWNSDHQTLPAWNGRIKGLRKGSRKDDCSEIWDYERALEEEFFSKGPKGLLGQRKSKSFDSFCEGLNILNDDVLPKFCDEGNPGKTYPTFIILNEPERFRDWADGQLLLTSFTRLGELSGCPVHTIFISQLPWSKLRPRYGALDPPTVIIPRLSHEDLTKILVSEGPPKVLMNESDHDPSNNDRPQPGFPEFVSFIVSSFESHTSSDLFELSSLVNRLWPGWIKAMKDGGFDVGDTAKMILLSRPIIELEQKSYGRPVWYLPEFLKNSGGISVATQENSNELSNESNGPDSNLEDEPNPTRTIASFNNSSPRKQLQSKQKQAIQNSPIKNFSTNIPVTTPSKSKNYLTIFSPLSSSSILNSSQPHQLFLNLTTPFKNSKQQKANSAPFIGSSSSSNLNDRSKLNNDFNESLSISSLPVVSKFLLVSSYLASYNPAKSDLKVFFTGANENGKSKRGKVGRVRKLQPGQEVKKKTRQELLGPKPFTIQRLFAIFYAILDQEGYQNFYQIDSIQQVGSLIKSKLILISNQTNNLNNGSYYDFCQSSSLGNNLNGVNNKFESIKFKCGLNLDQVKMVCKSLNNFDLQSRIWEVED